MNKKLILNKCEIDNCNVSEALHLHHIIERTKINTSNHLYNLCILCPTHHSLVHVGKIKLIGLFPSTELPNKRTLVYEIDGVRNIEIDDSLIFSYLKGMRFNKPKSFKI